MVSGKEMKFAVWGAGVRGNLAVSFLGIENIEVFIDENPRLCGCVYQGREIISYREYKERFSECYIIVSPNDCTMIIDILEKEGIKNYSILEDIIY